jgi:hypothetical protein
MSSVFRQLFDSIISALGGGYDKPPQPKDDRPLQAEDITGQQYSFYGFPIDAATDCRVCGIAAAKPEYYDQFCSYECEQRMADSLDAWHDQFQERFGDD